MEQLSEDLKRLDNQTEKSSRIMIYKRNKRIFLLQSMLLGISYSIIWPTLLRYIEDYNSSYFISKPLKHLFYGITYVYPLGSMVSAKLVTMTELSTKSMILLLNTFEIVGNLLFTVGIIPLLPAFGRFFAGLGDAFYVVLMRQMHTYGETANERLTMECLAAFVLGVILSPGINIGTYFLKFHIGWWRVNSGNFPGLTAAILFSIMQIVILVFLRVNEDDDKTTTTAKEERQNQQDKVSTSSDSSKFVEAKKFIREMEYTAWFVNVFSFVYTFVVATFELMVPFLMYERIQASTVGVMLMYAMIGTIYAMLLMMTMSISFAYQPEIFVCISVVMQIAGLFSIMYFTWLSQFTIAADIFGIAVIVLALTSMWSIDDVLFINFVQMFVPYHQREKTHNMRKTMSKIAFGCAGLIVPVLYGGFLLYFVPILIVAVCFLFVVFVIIKLTVTKPGQE